MTATPADDLSLAAQVDSACDRFESEFRANQHPRLEAFLAGVKEPSRSKLFQSLLEVELELRQSQGKSFGPEDYATRFPEYRQIIDEAIQHARDFPGKRSSVIITGVETSRGPSAKKGNPPSANVSLPLSKIGRFQVVTLLGEGAFGSVYKAHDPQLDREVAIKVPRSAAHRSVEERERFLREGRAAAALHHPNICPVYEVGTTPEGRDYIVMAFIEGRPLSRVLQAPQRLSDRQIVNAVRRLALALEEAHAKGIIHRDLKPANIMINRKGEPVIMDFGLARRATATDAQISHSGQIMGTPAYMSPEQARGDIKGVGPLSDLYSLGLVMYEMLCGRRPFEGTVTEVIGQILHVEPPPPSQFRKEIDPQLESICLKAIAKRPDDRFASMKDFATALSQYATTLANAKPGSASSGKDIFDSGDPLHTQQLAKLVAAVSSDVESKINRAAGRMARQVGLFGGAGRPPLWVTLAGSGFMGLVVLLGILFFVQAGDTTILIQVPLPPGVDLEDTSLAFFLDEKPIPAEQIGQPIELTPGDHELVIRRGDEIVERIRFAVEKDGKNWNIARVKTDTDSGSPQPAVAPFTAEEAREHQEAWAKHLGVPVEFTNSIGMSFRLIPPGEYSRGTPADEYRSVLPTLNNDPWLTQCLESEKLVHRVKLTRPFYLGTHEVTQRQYERMAESNPSQFSASGEGREQVAGKDTSEFPVERVNWDEVLEFCNRLSQSESLIAPKIELRAGELSLSPGDGYRLPTEAEWEYACRAGTTSRFWTGENAESLDQAGWYAANSEQRTHAVGELRPNPFGLFDIHGNTWEWVQDWWNKDSYKPFAESPAVDPLGAAMGSGQPLRVVRGGFMGYGPNWSRSAHRNGFAANTRFGFIGFRVVLTADGVKKLLSAPHQKTNLASDWTELFNGKDLTGWRNTGESSVVRGWTIKDGSIIRNRASPVDSGGREWQKNNLWTQGQYDDFVLELEFRGAGTNTLVIRADQPNDWFKDHGLHVPLNLPGTPGNYWLPGSFYPFQSPEHAPNIKSGWNHLRVTAAGPDVTVELNDETINVINLDRWAAVHAAKVDVHMRDILKNLARRGHIGFNAREGDIALRNIRIRELVPTKEGFDSLFNGNDLAGWQGATDAFEVADGVLKSVAGRRGTLFSIPEYDDFVLKLEFRISQGANNGLAIRYPGTGDPAREGMCEIQIIDPAIPIDDPRQRLGSAYGLAAARETPLKPAGEWNQQTVTVRGSKVQVELNGSLILDTDLATVSELAFNRSHPGKDLTKGHVGFFAINGVAEFREIGIKKLSPAPANATDGFVPLFNGDSLTGWQGQQDLWSLRDGVLTGQPTTGRANTFLFSPRPYTDFELRFQTRIGESDNSGVQIRSDVLDPQKWTARGPQADIGNRQSDFWGGVYAEELPGGWLLKPDASPAVKPTDWNDYVIRCAGRRVTIQVNGATTVAGEIDVLQATGLLAFQIHRSNQQPVEFRQIQIRELGGEFAESQPLFNGRDLTGWKVSGAADWTVRDGAVFVAGTKSGELTCERQFEDFELTGEVFSTAKGNGAIQFRHSSQPINQTAEPGGYEFQVAGSQGDPGKNYTGGLYESGRSAIRVNPPVAKDSTWTTIRLRVEGNHLQGWVNDRPTFDLQGKPERLTGRLLKVNLFAQGGEVGYRNFKIRPLARTEKTTPKDARVFNGHSYKFFPEQLSWKEAKARCESIGGHLAMVESLEENAFVAELVAAAGKVDAWIGATDEFSEGQWRWSDGHLMTWTNWFQDQKQPNNKGGVEHFGLMSNQKLANGKTIGWQWSDQPNESTQHQPGFVCEWE